LSARRIAPAALLHITPKMRKLSMKIAKNVLQTANNRHILWKL
jgi:hypothetical protein